MKLKPLFFSVIFLTAIAIVANNRKQSQSEEKSLHEAEGKPLISRSTLEITTQILLSDKGQQKPTVLEKVNNTWVLPHYHGLPVDFEKLQSFTKELTDRKIQRLVTKNSDRIKGLGFGQKRIEFLAAEKEPIISLSFGKKGQSSGEFVQFNDEPIAFLSTETFLLKTSQTEWADSKVLRFAEKDVRSITLEASDGNKITLHRVNEVAPFQSEGIPNDKEIDQSKVNSLITNFLNAEFNKIVPSGSSDALGAKASPTVVTFTCVDKSTYTASLGKRAAITVETRPTPLIGPTQETAVIPSVGLSSPGPVFIFYTSNQQNFIWKEIQKNIDFSYSDFLFDSLPKNLDALFQPKPISESAEGKDEVQ